MQFEQGGDGGRREDRQKGGGEGGGGSLGGRVIEGGGKSNIMFSDLHSWNNIKNNSMMLKWFVTAT